jgi:calcium permeable stress-gated cation channel
MSAKAHKREVQDQLSAALESFPDELADLSPEERDAELKAAFQDPVTRQPAPVIWIPQDPTGISDDTLRHVRTTYGPLLQYSNSGAYLSAKNKCEITQPAPDVRPDWLLDWVL